MSREKGDEACSCVPQKKMSQKLRDIFKKSAACACGPAGGFLLGHAGCVITPLVLAFSGAAAVTGSMAGTVSMAVGAVFTTVGLFAWEKLRGAKAGKVERNITYIGAVSGVLLSAAFHLASHHKHMDQVDPKLRYKNSISCPPPAHAE